MGEILGKIYLSSFNQKPLCIIRKYVGFKLKAIELEMQDKLYPEFEMDL